LGLFCRNGCAGKIVLFSDTWNWPRFADASDFVSDGDEILHRVQSVTLHPAEDFHRHHVVVEGKEIFRGWARDPPDAGFALRHSQTAERKRRGPCCRPASLDLIENSEMMDSGIYPMSTATTVAVPLEEYLSTIYHPDCDYVDDHLEERTLGEFEHGDLQRALAQYLGNNMKRFRVRTVTEARLQVAPRRFRIPDVCCIRRRPSGGIITEAPVLCIEILSPEDRVARVQARIADYLAMGVPFVWLIDPENLNRAFIYERGQVSPREVSDRVLTAGEIRVNLDELPWQEDFE
jgi:Uma2 family endonuclease